MKNNDVAIDGCVSAYSTESYKEIVGILYFINEHNVFGCLRIFQTQTISHCRHDRISPSPNTLLFYMLYSR